MDLNYSEAAALLSDAAELLSDKGEKDLAHKVRSLMFTIRVAGGLRDVVTAASNAQALAQEAL